MKKQSDIEKFAAMQPSKKKSWSDSLEPGVKERIEVLRTAFWSGDLPNFRGAMEPFSRALMKEFQLGASIHTVVRWVKDGKPS